MNVAVINLPDRTIPCAIYSYDDHKEAVLELKKMYNVEGYLLIKRSDVTLLRTQKNTRSAPVQFLQVLPDSYLSNVETGDL